MKKLQLSDFRTETLTQEETVETHDKTSCVFRVPSHLEGKLCAFTQKYYHQKPRSRKERLGSQLPRVNVSAGLDSPGGLGGMSNELPIPCRREIPKRKSRTMTMRMPEIQEGETLSLTCKFNAARDHTGEFNHQYSIQEVAPEDSEVQTFQGSRNGDPISVQGTPEEASLFLLTREGRGANLPQVPKIAADANGLFLFTPEDTDTPLQLEKPLYTFDATHHSWDTVNQEAALTTEEVIQKTQARINHILEHAPEIQPRTFEYAYYFPDTDREDPSYEDSRQDKGLSWKLQSIGLHGQDGKLTVSIPERFAGSKAEILLDGKIIERFDVPLQLGMTNVEKTVRPKSMKEGTLSIRFTQNEASETKEL